MGFSRTFMTPEHIREVYAAYGYEVATFLPTQKGYRNRSFPAHCADGITRNFILYKDEPGILRRITHANAVANHAASAGLPARVSIGRTIQLSTDSGVRYGALYGYLPGETIPWEAYTAEHIKLLGGALGQLHADLQNMPGPADFWRDFPSVAQEYVAIYQRMMRYFADPAVQAAVQEKLGVQPPTFAIAEHAEFLAACDNLPNQQPLHMDFVRSNILFQTVTPVSRVWQGPEKPRPHISGILDFEKTSTGHPFFDIARTLAFLLVDCKYKQPEKIRAYFLDSGYAKRGGQRLHKTIVHAPHGSVDLLEALIDCFLLHDFYKFLRHNPYESLSENEHYQRTVQLLQERGLVQSVAQKL